MGSRSVWSAPARVAKLADAGGLNPPSTHVEYGFESRPGHHLAGDMRIAKCADASRIVEGAQKVHRALKARTPLGWLAGRCSARTEAGHSVSTWASTLNLASAADSCARASAPSVLPRRHWPKRSGRRPAVWRCRGRRSRSASSSTTGSPQSDPRCDRPRHAGPNSSAFHCRRCRVRGAGDSVVVEPQRPVAHGSRERHRQAALSAAVHAST